MATVVMPYVGCPLHRDSRIGCAMAHNEVPSPPQCHGTAQNPTCPCPIHRGPFHRPTAISARPDCSTSRPAPARPEDGSTSRSAHHRPRGSDVAIPTCHADTPRRHATPTRDADTRAVCSAALEIWPRPHAPCKWGLAGMRRQRPSALGVRLWPCCCESRPAAT